VCVFFIGVYGDQDSEHVAMCVILKSFDYTLLEAHSRNKSYDLFCHNYISALHDK